MAGGVLGSLWRENRSFSSSCGCKEQGCVQEGGPWHPGARQDACAPEQFQDRSKMWPGVIYTSANVMKLQGAPHEATGEKSSCHLDCASVLPQAVDAIPTEIKTLRAKPPRKLTDDILQHHWEGIIGQCCLHSLPLTHRKRPNCSRIQSYGCRHTCTSTSHSENASLVRFFFALACPRI